jgi:two-component system, NarL family, nitrate/nitrite response regulator NarL
MIRVLIVVNVRLYREGLVQLLNARDEFTIVGAELNGREPVERLDEMAPDVALVDIGIPDLDEICRALARRSPPIPLVAIGISDSDSDVLACAERGIAGYVTRDSSVEALTAAIQGAADGELICSPRIAGTLIRRLGELAARSDRDGLIAHLTRRESQVAALMCEDLSNKEIATRLGVEVATVKNHVHNVLDKLRVHRRAEAVRLLAHPANRLVSQD